MAFNFFKSRLTPVLWPGLFLSLTFFVFAPLDLYLHNVDELWFDFSSTVTMALACGALAWVGLLFIGVCLPDKIRRYYALLLIGGGLAFYVQGNFLQVNYGLLDGRDVDWAAYTTWGVFNSAIWLICLGLPFILIRRLPRLVKTLPVFLVGVQLIITMLLLVSTDWSKPRDHYLSDKNIFNLSDSRNVIVFVLDSFDTEIFDQNLLAYPELRQAFSDFTYYQNTVGKYPRTKYALPFILTGIPYKNECLYNPCYLDKAYVESPLLNIMQKLSLSIGLYTGKEFVSSQAAGIDNLVKDNLQINNKMLFVKKIYNFTLLKYAPHVLKRFFWVYSDVFEELKTANKVEDSPYRFFNDAAFYKKLRSEKISLKKQYKNGAFRLYHLRGAHEPFVYNENLEQIGNSTAAIQTRAVLKLIEEYINQLKEYNVYNNTMIIVMADHGVEKLSYSPLLLLKKYAENKAFEVSSAPISFDDIHPTIIKYLTGKNALPTIDEWSENQKRDRVFYYYDIDNNKNERESLPLVEYVVSGTTRDDQVHRKSGKIYDGISSGPPDFYKLGDVLNFAGSEDVHKYIDTDICWAEKTHTWSSGKRTGMLLPLEAIPEEDLETVVNFKSYYNAKGPQRMIVSANNQQVYDSTLTADSPLVHRFTIPKELITSKELALTFDYPDAVAPCQVSDSSDDCRVLAVAFEKMVITAGKSGQADDAISSGPPDFYKLGDVLILAGSEEVHKYVETGLCAAEETHTWSSDKRTEMLLPLEAIPEEDLEAVIKFRLYYNGKGPQRLIVSANNQQLYEAALTADSPLVQRFTIPKELITSKELALTFDYPDAVAPCQVSDSSDCRVLAVAFEKMVITESLTK